MVGGTGWEAANLFVEAGVSSWKVCEEWDLSEDIGAVLDLVEILGEVAAVVVQQHRMGLARSEEAEEDNLGEKMIVADRVGL